MIFDIIVMALIAILNGLFIWLYIRQNKCFNQLARLAANFIELEKKIDSIDESTGADIFRVQKDLEAFKADFGDAAIEEMRQAARSEKAWADGVNSIMSYGARFQGGGNTA